MERKVPNGPQHHGMYVKANLASNRPVSCGAWADEPISLNTSDGSLVAASLDYEYSSKSVSPDTLEFFIEDSKVSNINSKPYDKSQTLDTSFKPLHWSLEEQSSLEYAGPSQPLWLADGVTTRESTSISHHLWDVQYAQQPHHLASYPHVSTHIEPQSPTSSRSTYSFGISVDCSSQSQSGIFLPSSLSKQKRNTGYTPTSNTPKSARDIYLEKNRNAASKCRNKQKREQEELIEEARDAEQKNKVLKARVAILEDELRELMVVLETHAECQDKRLGIYVGRKKERKKKGANEL